MRGKKYHYLNALTRRQYRCSNETKSISEFHDETWKKWSGVTAPKLCFLKYPKEVSRYHIYLQLTCAGNSLVQLIKWSVYVARASKWISLHVTSDHSSGRQCSNPASPLDDISNFISVNNHNLWRFEWRCQKCSQCKQLTRVLLSTAIMILVRLKRGRFKWNYFSAGESFVFAEWVVMQRMFLLIYKVLST